MSNKFKLRSIPSIFCLKKDIKLEIRDFCTNLLGHPVYQSIKLGNNFWLFCRKSQCFHGGTIHYEEFESAFHGRCYIRPDISQRSLSWHSQRKFQKVLFFQYRTRSTYQQWLCETHSCHSCGRVSQSSFKSCVSSKQRVLSRFFWPTSASFLAPNWSWKRSTF